MVDSSPSHWLGLFSQFILVFLNYRRDDLQGSLTETAFSHQDGNMEIRVLLVCVKSKLMINEQFAFSISQQGSRRFQATAKVQL